MPVQPQIDINADKVQRKLQKLSKKSGVAIGFICEDQLRLWTHDLMRKTPPRKLKTGRAIIEAGIAELFEPAETKAALEFWRDRLREQSSDVITYTKRGKMRIPRKALKAESVRQMAKIHKASRTARGGVSRSKALKKVGPQYAFYGKMIVAQSEYRKYLRKKQRMAGWLKAGWVPALEHYSRKTRANAKVPSWVKKHSRPRGFPEGKIDRKGNGFVAAINAVTYSNQRIGQERLVEITQGKRQRDLTRGGFKRMHDLKTRYGLGKG